MVTVGRRVDILKGYRVSIAGVAAPRLDAVREHPGPLKPFHILSLRGIPKK